MDDSADIHVPGMKSGADGTPDKSRGSPDQSLCVMNHSLFLLAGRAVPIGTRYAGLRR